jgi:uncharacterized membrane protein
MKHRKDDVCSIRRVLSATFLVCFGLAAWGCGDAASLPSEPAADPEEQAPAEPEYRYEALPLGTLGGSESNAWSINDAGVMAGWSSVQGGRALRWTGDGAADFTGLPSGSRGINAAGDIVGYVDHSGGRHAYVMQGSNRISLEPLGGWGNTFAWDINDSGTVVGTSSGKVVVWRPTADGGYEAPIDLHLYNGTERIRVNSRGDVAFKSSGNGWPVIWLAEPDGSYGEPLWLGRPEVGGYFVRGLNDAGAVVGSRSTGSTTVAVLWLPENYDQPIELGSGEAWDINAHNQIVGTTGGDLPLFGGALRRPAMWTIEADGSITGPEDLGTPTGLASGGARAISDNGSIVGSSWGTSSAVRATLWRRKD